MQVVRQKSQFLAITMAYAEKGTQWAAPEFKRYVFEAVVVHLDSHVQVDW